MRIGYVPPGHVSVDVYGSEQKKVCIQLWSDHKFSDPVQTSQFAERE
jgi:hypothetical protein